MRESCHMWMSSQSYFTHVDESCHVWARYGSCHTWMRHFTTHIPYKWVMSHVNEFSVFTCARMDQSCHIWVSRYGLYHTWMRHFTTNIPYKWVMSHVNEFSVSFHTCEWDMRHVTCRWGILLLIYRVWTSSVTRTNLRSESSPAYECVMSRANEALNYSYITYAQVMSHTWMSCPMSYVNETCYYGVAATSRLLKIMGLFCKRDL